MNGQQYLKRYSTSLIIGEMQINTTIRYVLLPVRMSIIKKTRDNKYWRGFGEKGTLCTVGGIINWYSHYDKQCVRPSKNQKQNYHMMQQLCSGNISKGNKNSMSKRYICTPMFVAALFTVANVWKYLSICQQAMDKEKQYTHFCQRNGRISFLNFYSWTSNKIDTRLD